MAVVLSYIVPVYNTAPWLRKCIDTLLCHSGSDIEFLFIDDGSIDESPRLIDEYACIDSRIKVIRQKNMGLSASRNIGLKSARGKYIVFIDSDDYIDAASVQRMLDAAIYYDADVVSGCVTCVDVDSETRAWGRNYKPGIYNSGLDFLAEVTNQKAFVPMVFNYLVKKDLLVNSGLSFMCGIVHEDELWTPQLFVHADKVVVTEERHYFYRVNRPGSIMSSKKTIERIISLGYITRGLWDEVMSITKNFNSEYCCKVLPFFQRRFMVFYSIVESLSFNSDNDLICQFMRGHCMAINHFIKNSVARIL